MPRAYMIIAAMAVMTAGCSESTPREVFWTDEETGCIYFARTGTPRYKVDGAIDCPDVPERATCTSDRSY